MDISILRASPADIAAGAGVGESWIRLSWRRSAGDQAAEPAKARQYQRDNKDEQGSRSHDDRERAREGMSFPRFAPEFDGIECFETIVADSWMPRVN